MNQKFEIFNSKRTLYVRKVGEQMKDVFLKPTVKHGGGFILVCVCLTANGVGDLVRINGIKSAEKYRQILIHHAISSCKHLIGNGFIFQKDNDSKHTALKVKSYLE